MTLKNSGQPEVRPKDDSTGANQKTHTRRVPRRALRGKIARTVPRMRAICPLWVKSGHCGRSAECPLYPQKQTLVECVGMSAKCQKRTFNLSREVRFIGRPSTGLSRHRARLPADAR